jgi:hypothetical protein
VSLNEQIVADLELLLEQIDVDHQISISSCDSDNKDDTGDIGEQITA